MESRKTPAARAERGLRLRERTAAAPSAFRAASKIPAETSRWRGAIRATAFSLLAVLYAFAADTNGHSSNTTATAVPVQTESAAQGSAEPGGRHSAADRYSNTSSAPGVLLAAAEKVRDGREDLLPRGSRFKAKDESSEPAGLGLQGRLRGRGPAPEGLRIQQRGKQTEPQSQQSEAVLPRQRPAAAGFKGHRALAAAPRQAASVVLNRQSGGRHVNRSGAPLTAVHKVFDRAFPHPRHLGDADVAVDGENPEAPLPSRATEPLAEDSPLQAAAKRGLQNSGTPGWWETYLPQVKQGKPAPLPDVVNDELDEGIAIDEVLDLSSNEDSTFFDSFDSSMYSYESGDGESSLNVGEHHALDGDLGAVVLLLDNADVEHDASGRYDNPARREEGRKTSAEIQAGNDVEPPARVTADAAIPMWLDLVFSEVSENSTGEKLGKVPAARDDTAASVHLGEISLAHSLLEDASGKSTAALTDSPGPAMAAAALDPEASTAAGVPSGLPRLGQLGGLRPPPASTQLLSDMRVAEDLPKRLHRFNMEPRYRDLLVKPVARPPRLSPVPEESEDSPSYINVYPAARLEHDVHTSVAPTAYWEDEQLEQLLSMQTPTAFQKPTEGGAQRNRAPPHADVHNPRHVEEEIIRPTVAQKLYSAPPVHAPPYQSSGLTFSDEESTGKKADSTALSAESTASTASRGDSRIHPIGGNRVENKGNGNGRQGSGGHSVEQEGFAAAKTGGNPEIGESTGPFWHRPPVMNDSARNSFLTRPYPSWYKYFPSSPTDNKDNPFVLSPDDLLPAFPWRPNPADERFQHYLGMLCQLSGYGQRCPPGNGKTDAEAGAYQGKPDSKQGVPDDETRKDQDGETQGGDASSGPGDGAEKDEDKKRTDLNGSPGGDAPTLQAKPRADGTDEPKKTEDERGTGSDISVGNNSPSPQREPGHDNRKTPPPPSPATEVATGSPSPVTPKVDNAGNIRPLAPPPENLVLTPGITTPFPSPEQPAHGRFARSSSPRHVEEPELANPSSASASPSELGMRRDYADDRAPLEAPRKPGNSRGELRRRTDDTDDADPSDTPASQDELTARTDHIDDADPSVLLTESGARQIQKSDDTESADPSVAFTKPGELQTHHSDYLRDADPSDPQGEPVAPETPSRPSISSPSRPVVPFSKADSSPSQSALSAPSPEVPSAEAGVPNAEISGLPDIRVPAGDGAPKESDPTAPAAVMPLKNSSPASPTTSHPPAFIQISASLPRPPAYRPLPIVIPVQQLNSSALLQSLTAPQLLPDPLAAVVSALLAQ